MKCFTIPIPAEQEKASEARLECYFLDMSPKIRWKARPVVILCPGGAYYFTNDRESEPMAMAFLSKGFHVVSLRYSVEKGIYPEALRQLTKVVAMLRERASEWNIDPQRIILAGFSAGGHLAAEFCCKWNRPELAQWASKDAQMLKPNALILGYPVITAGKYMHELSIENLLGAEDSPAMRGETSLEKQVTDAVPPTFLWHTCSDEMVPVQNSLLFAQALSDNSVPYEMHIFPYGVHGLGLGNRCTVEADKHVDDRCASWFEEACGFLDHYLKLEQ